MAVWIFFSGAQNAQFRIESLFYTFLYPIICGTISVGKYIKYLDKYKHISDKLKHC